MTDFTIENHGSIWLLSTNTDAASDWVTEHIPDDAQTWGPSIVVEPRYVDNIVAGIQAAGLTIE